MRILSISYDASLLFTRQLLLQQKGYEVISAEGFAQAWEVCETEGRTFDLVILGHSIPPKDKEGIITHLREHCDAPILALLRPHESPVKSATRSVDADAEKFIAAVRQMLPLK
jgi:DNA-binding response OmpR family regulator